MSGQNSIVEHRANYFFLKIEEDYLELFKGKKYQHCKAAILSILEGWMNKKRFEGCKHDDLFAYMSYPQFVNRMFGLFGRSTVIRSLDELIAEKIVISRPYVDAFNQSTFEYRIDVDVLHEKLRALPDKSAGNVKVNGGSVKINDPHVKEDDGSSKNTRGGSVKVNDGWCKSKRNVDTNIDTNIDTNVESKDVRLNVSPPTPISSSSQPSSSQQTEKPQQGSLMPEQGKKKKADLPPVSAEAERIIERWIAANGGKLLPLSKALVEAAEKLVPANPSKETLICIKNFALQHDTRGWYKQKGNSVTLGDIVNEYERWLSSTQSQLQAMQTETPPSQRNSLNLEENHKWAARMAEKTRQGAAKKG